MFANSDISLQTVSCSLNSSQNYAVPATDNCRLRASGRITPERYDKLAVGYETEQRELVSELAKLSTELDSMHQRDKCIREFIENAKANLEIKEITPKILKTFISRIDVYEKPEK